MNRHELIDVLRLDIPKVMARHDVPAIDFTYSTEGVIVTGALTQHATGALAHDLYKQIRFGSQFECRLSVYSPSSVRFSTETVWQDFLLDRSGLTFTLDKELANVWLQYDHQLLLRNALTNEACLPGDLPEDAIIERVTS